MRKYKRSYWIGSLLSVLFLSSGCDLSIKHNTGASTPTPTPGPGLSFSPSSGPIGTLVTLTPPAGVSLAGTQAISLAGVSVTPISVSASSVVGIIMPGSTTGPIVVTGTSNSLSSKTNFTVTTVGPIANQQGPKVTPNDNTGTAYAGVSVAISADGSTVMMGGYADNSHVGAAWAFTRNGSTWTQQGPKLTPSDETGASYFGNSVALSADGNSALIGGYFDNYTMGVGATGAIWYFTRSNGVWTQQGTKIVPSDSVGVNVQFGACLSMSPDGTKAVVGGWSDNNLMGATWVFTKTNGVWTQQGNKLVGTGSTGTNVYQGSGVQISADGNTIFTSAYGDNTNIGAFWIFTNNNGVWTQQGNIVTPTGSVGAGKFGFPSAGAISLDTNTVAVGAAADNGNLGAVYVFNRINGVWTQMTKILPPPDETGAGYFGRSVAMSGDASTLVIGGSKDNGNIGAYWVFRGSGASWTQQGAKLVGSGATAGATLGLSVALTPDGTVAAMPGDADSGTIGSLWVYTP